MQSVNLSVAVWHCTAASEDATKSKTLHAENFMTKLGLLGQSNPDLVDIQLKKGDRAAVGLTVATQCKSDPALAHR